ncbi:unnamed protein product [Amoebophrya sp. A120]|nr:unnamed protein product [Amoebophrya sp. A120]|eukprot:GSA120T00011659001.1
MRKFRTIMNSGITLEEWDAALNGEHHDTSGASSSGTESDLNVPSRVAKPGAGNQADDESEMFDRPSAFKHSSDERSQTEVEHSTTSTHGHLHLHNSTKSRIVKWWRAEARMLAQKGVGCCDFCAHFLHFCIVFFLLVFVSCVLFRVDPLGVRGDLWDQIDLRRVIPIWSTHSSQGSASDAAIEKELQQEKKHWDVDEDGLPLRKEVEEFRKGACTGPHCHHKAEEGAGVIEHPFIEQDQQHNAKAAEGAEQTNNPEPVALLEKVEEKKSGEERYVSTRPTFRDTDAATTDKAAALQKKDFAAGPYAQPKRNRRKRQPKAPRQINPDQEHK